MEKLFTYIFGVFMRLGRHCNIGWVTSENKLKRSKKTILTRIFKVMGTLISILGNKSFRTHACSEIINANHIKRNVWFIFFPTFFRFILRPIWKIKSFMVFQHEGSKVLSLHLCWFLADSSFNTWLISILEKKNVVTSWATDKMTTIFYQNDNFDNFEWNNCLFVHLLSL
jgi:hypothetical protein